MTLAFDLPACSETWVSRLDPRWKLAGLLLAALLLAPLQTPAAALAALAATSVLAIAARSPWRWVAVRLGLALVLLAFLVVWRPLLPRAGDETIAMAGLTVSLTGLRFAIVLLARAAAVVLLMLVLIATAPIHETFKAAHALHVPGLLVQLALLTYRYVFLLADEFARLRIALRVRGYRNRADRRSYQTIGHVAGSLLVRSHERSERIAQAMRCRGFAGEFRSLQRPHTAVADVTAFVVIVGSAAGLLAWDVLRR